MARADVIEKLLLAGELALLAVRSAVIGHPGCSVTLENAVVDAGGLVVEAAGKKSVRRYATPTSHGGLLVVLVDGLVAARAYGVRIVQG